MNPEKEHLMPAHSQAAPRNYDDKISKVSLFLLIISAQAALRKGRVTAHLRVCSALVKPLWHRGRNSKSQISAPCSDHHTWVPVRAVLVCPAAPGPLPVPLPKGMCLERKI